MKRDLTPQHIDPEMPENPLEELEKYFTPEELAEMLASEESPSDLQVDPEAGEGSFFDSKLVAGVTLALLAGAAVGWIWRSAREDAAKKSTSIGGEDEVEDGLDGLGAEAE